MAGASRSATATVVRYFKSRRMAVAASGICKERADLYRAKHEAPGVSARRLILSRQPACAQSPTTSSDSATFGMDRLTTRALVFTSFDVALRESMMSDVWSITNW